MACCSKMLLRLLRQKQQTPSISLPTAHTHVSLWRFNCGVTGTSLLRLSAATRPAEADASRAAATAAAVLHSPASRRAEISTAVPARARATATLAAPAKATAARATSAPPRRAGAAAGKGVASRTAGRPGTATAAAGENSATPAPPPRRILRRRCDGLDLPPSRLHQGRQVNYCARRTLREVDAAVQRNSCFARGSSFCSGASRSPGLPRRRICRAAAPPSAWEVAAAVSSGAAAEVPRLASAAAGFRRDSCGCPAVCPAAAGGRRPRPAASGCFFAPPAYLLLSRLRQQQRQSRFLPLSSPFFPVSSFSSSPGPVTGAAEAMERDLSAVQQQQRERLLARRSSESRTAAAGGRRGGEDGKEDEKEWGAGAAATTTAASAEEEKAAAAARRRSLVEEDEQRRREQERRYSQTEVLAFSAAALQLQQQHHGSSSFLRGNNGETQRLLVPAAVRGPHAGRVLLQHRHQLEPQPAQLHASKDDGRDAVWLLLVNLGSPSQPTYGDVWEFLSQFLSDPRVIETSRILWSLFLKFFILPTRSYPTSRLYRRIWHADVEAEEAADADGSSEGGEARRRRLLHASERSGMWGEPPLIRYTAALGKKVQRRFNSFFMELQQRQQHQENQPREISEDKEDDGGVADTAEEQSAGGFRGRGGSVDSESEQQQRQQGKEKLQEEDRDKQQDEQLAQQQEQHEGEEVRRQAEALQSGAMEKMVFSKYLPFIQEGKDERSQTHTVRVQIGMRYGHPSIADALAQAQSRGCRKLLVLPLYPQTVAATTSSAYDAVFKELQKWRVMPDLRIISGYSDHPAYIRAVAASIRRFWKKNRRLRGARGGSGGGEAATASAAEVTGSATAAGAGATAAGAAYSSVTAESSSTTPLLQGEDKKPSPAATEESMSHTGSSNASAAGAAAAAPGRVAASTASGDATGVRPTASTAADEDEEDEEREEGNFAAGGGVAAGASAGSGGPERKLLGDKAAGGREQGGSNGSSSTTKKRGGLPRRVEKLIFSYHGIPESSGRQAGEIYQCLCMKTTRLVAHELGLLPGEYEIAYQSRVGRTPWVQPYLQQRLQELAGAGYTRVDVVEPGFAVDCLETLEEIGMQTREQWALWTEGRGELRSIPCLNASEEGTDAIFEIVKEQMVDWVAVRGRY